MNKKILFITFNLTNNGTYLRAKSFADELAKFGYEIDIISTSPINLFKHTIIRNGNVKIIEMPDLFIGTFRSGWDIWAILYRCIWIASKKYNIVHCFENRPAVIFPGLIQKMKGAELFSDWCDWLGSGGAIEERASFIIKHLLRPFETFFEISFRKYSIGTTLINKTLMNKAVNLNLNNLIIINNGIGNERLQQINKFDAQKKIILDSSKKFIGHVGKIFPQDAVLLASSFNLLVKERPDIKLVIIGNCNIDFKFLIDSSSHLIQTGLLNIVDLNYFMSAMDLFWIILNESNANNGRMPFKLSDIIAIGKPYLLTNSNCDYEFDPNIISFHCTPEINQIKNKTIQILNNLSNIQEKIDKIYPSIINKYSWRNQTQTLIDFYKKGTRIDL